MSFYIINKNLFTQKFVNLQNKSDFSKKRKL